MKTMHKKVIKAASYIKDIIGDVPQIAVGLGTGFSKFVTRLENPISIEYGDIPNFPHGEVEGHINALIVGTIDGIGVLCLAGRIHYYEGWEMQELTFPIRVLKHLGVECLLMSNASGGLNEDYVKGEVLLVKDHINLLPGNPLRGKHDERLGLRFPDMSDAYNMDLRVLAMRLAVKMNIDLREGVYAAMQGPSLETPAEYKMLHIIGADLVGMSTVPEVIVANQCGIKVLVFSIVTNICYPPENVQKTTIEDVLAVGNESADSLSDFLVDFIKELNPRLQNKDEG